MGILRKFVDELYIVTKNRGMCRIGDVINYAQADLVEICEQQLMTTGRIRVITLKARQIGISTIIEAIIFALTILNDHFKSLIVSHESSSAEHIKSITDNYWTTYQFNKFHTTKYTGRKHLSWEDTDSGLHIATAKNLDAGRSHTIHALHASEFAFWDKPSQFMTSLAPSVPNFGISAIFIESTANGIGNAFHTEWLDAVSGKSEFRALFYPWHQHPEYTASHLPPHLVRQYAIKDDMDEEELRLYKQGISYDRLIWRRYAIANLVNKDDKHTMHSPLDSFHQEYPSNPIEAFLSTGLNVFSLPALLMHYDPIEGTKGSLVRIGNRVEFTPNENGYLTLFAYPSKDKSWGIYQIGADPTHTTTGDYACAQVISRRTLEQVAVYRRKCDPITFGQDLYLLGLYFNQCTIAPEKEGPGYATVGYLLGQNYPNVWEHQKVDKTPGKVTADTFGWGTNQQTKHLAISNTIKAITDVNQEVGREIYGLIIHDQQTLNEMANYVTDTKGTGYCNADGTEYDDGVMALAIAITTHYIDGPVPPYDLTLGRQIAQQESPASRLDEMLAEINTSSSQILDNLMEKVPPWENWSDK
jgi:hypothetical protein